LFKFFLSVLFVASVNVQASESFSGKVERVADGDTVWVRPDSGERPLKLRLEGIDAPEICQPGGEASRTWLIKLALNQRVRVVVSRQDDYGRGLARLRLNGEDLGLQLVRSGQAWSYRWRRSLGPYAAEERSARQSRLGLFALADPELPRDFRKRHGSCHPEFKAK
jgi:endonuclease YncB( thermonuclease family)